LHGFRSDAHHCITMLFMSRTGIDFYGVYYDRTRECMNSHSVSST